VTKKVFGYADAVLETGLRKRMIRNLTIGGWLLVAGGILNLGLYFYVLFFNPWLDATVNGILGTFIYVIGHALLLEARFLETVARLQGGKHK